MIKSTPSQKKKKKLSNSTLINLKIINWNIFLSDIHTMINNT